MRRSVGSDVVDFCSPTEAGEGLRFRDVSLEVGAYTLDRAWGVSWRDIDWDGRPDLIWVNHDKRRIRLLRNLDGIHFAEKGEAIFAGGDAHAGALADLNADGLAELYVVNGYHLEDWFLEQSVPGVYETSERPGLSGRADVRGRSATWSDFDGDGDLDLHVQNLNTPDALFLQQADGSFADGADARGLQNTFNKFGAAAADLDGDGDVDIFIPVLEPMPNVLLLNRGDGVFVDRTFEWGLADAWAGRAVAVGDYDNDGLVDLYLAGVQRSSLGRARQGALFHNEGGTGFREVTGEVLDSPSCPDSRAAGFFDFDNDGWLDLYIACGADDEHRNHANILFHNQRGARFQEIEGAACAGAAFPGRTGSFAVGDYNLDGLQDIAVTNGFGAWPDSGANVVLRNESEAVGSWIRVFPRGGSGNLDGLGATVIARLATGQRIVRLVGTQQGMGHNESVVHVGLGDREEVADLRVRWPDGQVVHQQGVPAGQLTMPSQDSARLINSHPAALLGEVATFDLDSATAFITARLGHPLPAPIQPEVEQRQQEVLAWAMARRLDQQVDSSEDEIEAAWRELQSELERPLLHWAERFTISPIRQPKDIDQRQVGAEIASRLRSEVGSLELARELNFRSHGPRGSEYIRGALDVGWFDNSLLEEIVGEHATAVAQLAEGEVWGPEEMPDHRDYRGSEALPPAYVVWRMGRTVPAVAAERHHFEGDLKGHLRRQHLRRVLGDLGALARTDQIMGNVGFLHGVMYDVDVLATVARDSGVAADPPVQVALRRAEIEARVDRGLRELIEQSAPQHRVEEYVAKRRQDWIVEDRLDVVLYQFGTEGMAEEASQRLRSGESLNQVNEALELFPLTAPQARQLGRYYQELPMTRALWRRLTNGTQFDQLLELADGEASEVYAGAGKRYFVVWKRSRLEDQQFAGAEDRARLELVDEAVERLVAMTVLGGNTKAESVGGQEN